jgi:hypothetical protein
MHTDHTSEPNSGPRRAMRKGTRSCYECRKRKVRCIFGKNSSVCEGCVLRRKRCIEQSRELLQDQALESKESLKERVAKLEALLQSSSESKHRGVMDTGHCSDHLEHTLGTIIPDSASDSIVAKRTTSISANDALVSVDKDSPQNIDPIVTLFDNAIVSPTMYLKLWQTESGFSGDGIARNRPKIRSLKPMQSEIRQLLRNVHALVIRSCQVLFPRSYWDC